MDSVSRVTICLGWSNKLNLSLLNESVEAIIPPRGWYECPRTMSVRDLLGQCEETESCPE